MGRPTRFPDLPATKQSGCDSCDKLSRTAIRYDKVNDSGQGGCARCSMVSRGLQALFDWLETSTSQKLQLSDAIINSSVVGSFRSFNISFPSMLRVMTADFYVSSDKEAMCGSFPVRQHVIVEQTPLTGVRFAQSALRNCLDYHQCDIGLQRLYLPKRLIDVGSAESKHDIICVINKAELSMASCVKYAALSYCWGVDSQARKEMLKLASTTIESYKYGLRISDLPTAFQDAVTATRALGIQYLWIDALCIAQGDRDEWKIESLKMADTYSHALVTLSADASPTCKDSFLDTSRYRQWLRGIEIPTISGSVFVRFSLQSLYAHSDLFNVTSRPSELQTRGWTMQEILLSRRVISFRHSQAEFRCMRGHYREFDFTDDTLVRSYGRWTKAFEIGRPKEFSTWEFLSLWNPLLWDYGQRQFTEPSDRLIAIAGVATIIKSRTTPNNTYLAGLWKDTFLENLHWFHYRFRPLSKRGVIPLDPIYDSAELFEAGPYNSEPLDAPSWSWASITGKFRMPYHESRRMHSAFISTTQKWDCFGQVKTAQVVLRGPALQATLQNGLFRFEIESGSEVEFEARDQNPVFWDTPVEVAEAPGGRQATLRRSQDQQEAAVSDSNANTQVDLLLLSSRGKYAFFIILAELVEDKDLHTRLGLWGYRGYYREQETLPEEKSFLEAVSRLPFRQFTIV